MLQFVLLPNRCCLHSELSPMQRSIVLPHCPKCCNCFCFYCCCCCLTSLAGSVELPGQFTAKLLDKTVCGRTGQLQQTVLVMRATQPAPLGQSASSAWAAYTHTYTHFLGAASSSPLRLKNVKKLLLNAAKYNLLFSRGKRQTLPQCLPWEWALCSSSRRCDCGRAYGKGVTLIYSSGAASVS